MNSNRFNLPFIARLLFAQIGFRLTKRGSYTPLYISSDAAVKSQQSIVDRAWSPKTALQAVMWTEQQTIQTVCGVTTYRPYILYDLAIEWLTKHRWSCVTSSQNETKVVRCRLWDCDCCIRMWRLGPVCIFSCVHRVDLRLELSCLCVRIFWFEYAKIATRSCTTRVTSIRYVTVWQ